MPLRRTTAVLAAIGALFIGLIVAPPIASAQAQIDHIAQRTDRWQQVFVRSPAMQRVVQIDVLTPAASATPRPTLYLLDGNGADAAAGQS
ncbi:esterase family protein, partial [Nocardia gipuzkoensis]